MKRLELRHLSPALVYPFSTFSASFLYTSQYFFLHLPTVSLKSTESSSSSLFLHYGKHRKEDRVECLHKTQMGFTSFCGREDFILIFKNMNKCSWTLHFSTKEIQKWFDLLNIMNCLLQ